MTSTKRFDEIGKDDLALAGGKGANVGKFSHAGCQCRTASPLTDRALRGADRS